jgi:hypothetical protein
MKLSPELLGLNREILARIRKTSGMNADLELLEQLTRTLPGRLSVRFDKCLDGRFDYLKS